MVHNTVISYLWCISYWYYTTHLWISSWTRLKSNLVTSYELLVQQCIITIIYPRFLQHYFNLNLNKKSDQICSKLGHFWSFLQCTHLYKVNSPPFVRSISKSFALSLHSWYGIDILISDLYEVVFTLFFKLFVST